MAQIGIMQGRLSPPLHGRIQSFPSDSWDQEFAHAALVPFDTIEWIYEVQGAESNPLGSDDGLRRMQGLARRTGVQVRSICADYFMDRPFLRVPEGERAASEAVLVWLLSQCRIAGIERIVLPFVDVSRIACPGEFSIVVDVLQKILPVLDKAEVEIHLETDLPPAEFGNLLARVDHPLVLVNYDSGNSAALGYHPRDEFAAYGKRVGSVHIKDRIRGGNTVPPGEGSVDFVSLFTELAHVDYRREFILQAARGIPGDEINWARTNREFVERHLGKRR